MTLGLLLALFLAAVITGSVVTIDRTVDGNGVLEPLSVWAVRPLDVGIVTEILVRAGDSVRTGQIVARLDPFSARAAIADMEEQLRAARTDLGRLVRATPIEHARLDASVKGADARVLRARRTLEERMTAFGISGPLDSIVAASRTRVHVGLDAAAAEFLAAEADAEVVKTQLRSGELASMDIGQKEIAVHRLNGQLAMARERLQRTILVSPADGVVLTEELDHAIGSAIGAGQTLLEVADVRSWRAEVAVSENQVHQIQRGDRTIIELPAFASRPVDRLHGHVDAIASEHPGNIDPRNASVAPGSYAVRVAIDKGEAAGLERGALRRGYAVRAKIVLRSGTILSILRDYVRERARGLAR
jgi:multidrug resistance efflux pump